MAPRSRGGSGRRAQAIEEFTAISSEPLRGTPGKELRCGYSPSNELISCRYAVVRASSVPDMASMRAQLWKSFDRYDCQRPFSTWMYRVALNVAISQVRSVAIRQRHFTDAADDEIAQVQSPVSDPHEDGRLGALQAFMAGLDNLNRALLLLYLEDYSHKEIARILGITPTNVATKIGRLKQRIQREIN